MISTTTRLARAVVYFCALASCASVLGAHDMSSVVFRPSDPAFPSEPTGPVEGVLPVISSEPTSANINLLLGADAFYDQGLTGSNATLANVEAGHVWNGHAALGHVSTYVHGPTAFDDPNTPGAQQSDLLDRHATWVAAVAAGRIGGNSPGEFQRGIAFGATLQSGAIASSWNGSSYALGFGFDSDSFATPYNAFFGAADVINSSWGGSDPTGAGFFATLGDAFANNNPSTTWVVAAGNTGPAPNTSGIPASGYNAITVGALDNGGDNSYDQVADFSSRSPQDWAGGGFFCTACRAAVDITAPGSSLVSAFYGGTTGGNNTTLAGSVDIPGSELYTLGLGGTSFASPIVAGAATLVADASYADPLLAANANSRDARVVKAVLMNSATKIPGWDNGQTTNGGAIETLQALDFTSGAGALDIGAAYGQYVDALTQDVPGTAAGDQGQVGLVGWDFGQVSADQSNTYEIADFIPAGSEVTATLAWFRERTETFPSSTTAVDLGQADLDLIIREVDTGVVVARSVSAVNVVEHLHFEAPAAGRYEIEVNYFGDIFGALGAEQYGLAWAVAVPEPSAAALMVVAGLLAGRPARRN